MRGLAWLIGGLFLLTACAGLQPAEQAKYEANCRTHARKVSFSGSPDENLPYLECMRIKGYHEVEVSELTDMGD